MTRTFAALFYIAAASLSANAAAAPTFEQSLGQFRQDFLKIRAEQKNAKSLADIQQADKNVKILARSSWQLRTTLSDLRRRARMSHPTPGQPGGDPFFSSDLQRFVWNIKNLARNTYEVGRDVEQLALTAKKDPSLVAAAQSLADHASTLRAESAYLANEARLGAWDLRGAGYTFEAMDTERSGAVAGNNGREIDSSARELLSKVK